MRRRQRGTTILACWLLLCGTGALAADSAGRTKPGAGSPSSNRSIEAKADQAGDLAALRKLIEQQAELIKRLTERIDALEGKQAGAPAQKPAEPQNPPIPDVQIPAAPAQAQPPKEQVPPIPEAGINPAAPAQPPTRANLQPDLSVIGNNLGRFFSVSGDPDRNRFQLGEFEIGLQQPVYPGIRFDAFLAGGSDEDFRIAAEEAYATFSNIGHLPLGGLLGQKRLNFGKINPVHPHSRNYADQPAPLANLLGGDALAGNGASVNYLLPVKNLFANLEVGLWKTAPIEEGETRGGTFYPAGLGVNGDFPMGRLWLSKDLGKAAELELGASHGFGKSDIGDRIRLSGVDMTFRRFPGTFKRLLLQGELFWHNRDDRAGGTGSHTRSGYYLLGTWRPDQYKEYGIRFDNSRYPWPIEGRDRSLSLIWTDKLTEVTLLRLQLKQGDRTSDIFLPAKRGYTEGWLQFIWGAGPHVHSLQ